MFRDNISRKPSTTSEITPTTYMELTKGDVEISTPIANEKVQTHDLLCKEITALYAIKNEAYGDSFSKSYKEYGMTMPAIRLEDKLNRFKRLALWGSQPNDESIRDTLLDLANYALMTIMEIDSDGSK